MFKSSWGQHVLVIMAPLNTHPNTLNSQVERKKTKEKTNDVAVNGRWAPPTLPVVRAISEKGLKLARVLIKARLALGQPLRHTGESRTDTCQTAGWQLAIVKPPAPGGHPVTMKPLLSFMGLTCKNRICMYVYMHT